MRGCNEARPNRNWGEQGYQLQRPLAESAKTRGAEALARPAALKVQLREVAKIAGGHYLFSFRIKNFSPDQVSSMAQTLTSTRSIESANSLMVSSVMSVGTFEAFFGQEAHIIPSGAM